MILTLLIVITGMLIVFNIQTNMDGDSLYHLAFVNKLAENTMVTPNDAMFNVDAIPAAYGYNVWYLPLAGMISVSGVDAPSIWLLLSSFIIILALLSLGTLAETVFKRGYYALIAMAAFITYYGVFSGFFEFQLLPYPDQIARVVLLPTLFALVFIALRKQSKLSILYIACATIMISFIHLYSALAFALILGGYALYQFFSRENEKAKRVFLIGIVSLGSALLFTVIKIVGISSFVSGLPAITELRSDGIWISESLFIISPQSHLDIFRYIILGLMLIVFVYAFIKKREWVKSDWFVFIFITSILPFFILLNPYLVTYGSKLVTYTYIHRMWNLISFPLIITALIYVITNLLSSNNSKGALHNIRAHTGFLSSLIIFILIVPLFAGNYLTHVRSNIVDPQQVEEYFSGNPLLTDDIISYINNNLPHKQVIMSDSWTSYRLASMTNNYVVTSLWQHFSPVVDRSIRTADAKLILSSPDMGTILRLLEEYGVSYFLVNRPYTSFKSYLSLEDKIKRFNEFFTLEYENDNYALFSISASREKIDTFLTAKLHEINTYLNDHKYQEAINTLETLISLDSSNIEYLSLHEQIRNDYSSSLLDFHNNVMRFNAGAEIVQSTEFYPFPNNTDAIIDGKDFGSSDYAAAKESTLPNSFTVDFDIPRLLSRYTIQWYSEQTSGSEWTLSYKKDGTWIQIDTARDWDEGILYHKAFPSPILASSIMFELTQAKKQERALLKHFNIY
ncbi:discoidin domain-containing protein [Patescibacteria group bacterium]